MTRGKKRAFIIFIILAIVFTIVGLVMLSRVQPSSCFDQKLNQNESGIDCGGVCAACEKVIRAKDLIVEDVDVVFGGAQLYDIVATVRNPNTLYGGARVKYTFTLADASGNDLAQVRDEGFILPTQERFFAAINVPSDVIPATGTLKIDTVEWVAFADFQDPDFVLQNLSYGLVKDGTDYARIFGLVRNASPFDFAQVDVLTVLLDERGEPIAVNRTSMGSFDAGQGRDFDLPWSYRFPGVIADAKVGIYANVFDSQNYVRKYLPGGRFESFE